MEKRKLARFSVVHSCAISKLLLNSEVVHPRSQTGFVRSFDVPMKVENREKDCREKERVGDPEYH